MRVLIVDDSSIVRKLVLRTLRQIGQGHHEFIEMENGLKAYEDIKKTPPALVICDWNMPELNGIGLLNRINEEKLNIPFGFITSEGTDEMKALAMKSGAQFILTKPFSNEDLAQAVSKILK